MNAPNLPPLPPGYKLAGQFKDFPEQTEVFGLAFDPEHPEDGWVGADTLDMPWTTYQRDDEAVWWLAVQEDSPQALPNPAKAEALAAALEGVDLDELHGNVSEWADEFRRQQHPVTLTLLRVAPLLKALADYRA